MIKNNKTKLHITGKTKPSDCSTVQFDKRQLTQDTINNLNHYWPSFVSTSNESAWAKAFNEDGRCTFNHLLPIESIGEYFNIVVSMFQAEDVANLLLNANIWPRDDKPYRLTDVTAALYPKFVNFYELVCSGTKNNSAILREIKLCFNLRMERIACAGAAKPSCTTADVWYLQNSSTIGAPSVLLVLTAAIVALFASRD